jgi:hypothetical protein
MANVEVSLNGTKGGRTIQPGTDDAPSNRGCSEEDCTCNRRRMAKGLVERFGTIQLLQFTGSSANALMEVRRLAVTTKATTVSRGIPFLLHESQKGPAAMPR